MKDQILKGYVDTFSTSFGLNEPDESVIFEHFVNYCVTAKQYPRDFDYDNLHVGGSDDIGLDGAAFIVNGNIITAPEEIDYLIDVLTNIQVEKFELCLNDSNSSVLFKLPNEDRFKYIVMPMRI